jgi:type I restriction enzyme S subunit
VIEATGFLFNRLPKNWRLKKFGQILAEPVRNGMYKKKEFHGRGHKIVNMGELFAYDFISDQDMKRIELNDKERSKYLLEDGDLLFARRSLVLEGSGKCSLVVDPSEEITFESSIIRARLNKEDANPRFYCYFWNSPLGQALRASIATRTAVSGIRGSDLVQLEVPVPSLSTQRKIAAILSAYDDLIENNTGRIAILEQMAQLLYREWFVHFRFPGHEDVEMVDSEFGPIPEGWEVRTLRQFGEVVLGKTPSKRIPEYYGDHMPFIKIPDMHGKIFCTQTTEYLSEKGAESQKKKTLSPNSLCVSCIGSAGIVNITTVPSQTNQQINSIVLQNEPDREFMYFALLELEPTIQQHGATGATMVNLSKSKFVKLRVAYPDSKTIGAYHGIVYPHFEAIKNLQLQNQVLRRTRDLLLPRLISGELDVSELAIDVGEEDDHGQGNTR